MMPGSSPVLPGSPSVKRLRFAATDPRQHGLRFCRTCAKRGSKTGYQLKELKGQ